MAIYVLLSNLTDEGRKVLKERPERLAEVNQEIEKMGARVLAQYAVLGRRDFINIVEAPSNEMIARISLELGSRGTVRLTTLPALTIRCWGFSRRCSIPSRNAWRRGLKLQHESRPANQRRHYGSATLTAYSGPKRCPRATVRNPA